jgi:hypothetical protein
MKGQTPVAEMIKAMVERQDREIRLLRDNNERFRSIFGRLQTFVRDAGIQLEGTNLFWVSTESITEILATAEAVVDAREDKHSTPFGIHSMGAGGSSPYNYRSADGGDAIPQALDI